MLFSDQIVMLNEGRVIAEGAPKDVISTDNLKALYGIDVTIVGNSGAQVICPRIPA
jgi:iron complex transport system ATP-binding protein